MFKENEDGQTHSFGDGCHPPHTMPTNNHDPKNKECEAIGKDGKTYFPATNCSCPPLKEPKKGCCGECACDAYGEADCKTHCIKKDCTCHLPDEGKCGDYTCKRNHDYQGNHTPHLEKPSPTTSSVTGWEEEFDDMDFLSTLLNGKVFLEYNEVKSFISAEILKAEQRGYEKRKQEDIENSEYIEKFREKVRREALSSRDAELVKWVEGRKKEIGSDLQLFQNKAYNLALDEFINHINSSKE